jgi:hypothetical protein
VDKFPPKVAYMYGLNYFVMTTFRFWQPWSDVIHS